MSAFCRLVALAAVLFAVGILITGCGPIITDGATRGAPGQAGYSYKRVLADGSSCEVNVASGREVNDGEISVDKDCQMRGKANALTGAEIQSQMLDVTKSAVDALRAKLP